MFVWNPKKWKPATIKIIGLIAGGTLSAQTAWVKNHVVPMLANHPHWATIGTGLIMVLTLLHNPLYVNVVEQFLSQDETKQEVK